MTCRTNHPAQEVHVYVCVCVCVLSRQEDVQTTVGGRNLLRAPARNCKILPKESRSMRERDHIIGEAPDLIRPRKLRALG